MSENNYEQHGQQGPIASGGAPRREGWEREVLEKLAFATLAEQRSRRRWNIFFRFMTLGVIALGI